jgi:hypothetical protein
MSSVYLDKKRMQGGQVVSCESLHVLGPLILGRKTDQNEESG